MLIDSKESALMQPKTVTSPLKCRDDAEIIETIKKQNGNTILNGFIPVQVQSKEDTETLYGMPESVFMQYAKVLPPRKVYTEE